MPSHVIPRSTTPRMMSYSQLEFVYAKSSTFLEVRRGRVKTVARQFSKISRVLSREMGSERGSGDGSRGEWGRKSCGGGKIGESRVSRGQ